MNRRGRPGQTMVEVVMATLVAAMTASAVFSVLLSSFVSGAKADKRDAAAMSLRHAQQVLKAYVSAVPAEADYTAGAAGGRWPAATSGVWALRGVACAANSPPSVGTAHDISAIVQNPHPLSVNSASEDASLIYRVCSYDCGFGLGPAPDYPFACKRVAFTLTYRED